MGGSSPSDWVRWVSCLVQILGEKNHNSKAAIWRFSENFCKIFYRHLWRKNTADFWLATSNIKINANDFRHWSFSKVLLTLSVFLRCNGLMVSSANFNTLWNIAFSIKKYFLRVHLKLIQKVLIEIIQLQ